MPKILPSQKSLALSVMAPILFEAENYFNDLSLTKKSKKIPERLIFSKMNKYFALDFVFNSIAMCVGHPYWHGGARQIRSKQKRRPLKSNVLIFFNCEGKKFFYTFCKKICKYFWTISTHHFAQILHLFYNCTFCKFFCTSDHVKTVRETALSLSFSGPSQFFNLEKKNREIADCCWIRRICLEGDLKA